MNRCLRASQIWRQSQKEADKTAAMQLGAAETYCDNMTHGAVSKHVNCGEACIEQGYVWLLGWHNLGKALKKCFQSSDSSITHLLGRLCC